MKLRAVFWKNLRPRFLHVVEYERHEQHLRFLARRVLGCHRGVCTRTRRYAEVLKQIAAGDQTECENNDGSADAERAAHATARPTVFQIPAASSWRPFHRRILP
jgi:hypothetical protein